MTSILVYTAPATGHVFPLVPGLLELQRRGHRIHVRTIPGVIGLLERAGLDCSPIDDRVLGVAVTGGFDEVANRAPFDAADLDDAIGEHDPDFLIVDAIAYGALARAEASGLPWAISLPSLLPLPESGIPPYGLGLPPARGWLGRQRDRVLWRVVERAFGKAILPSLNGIRRDLGLAEFSSPLDQWAVCDVALTMTDEPLEYPRTSLPSNVAMVGFQPWEPPTAVPAYLDEPGDPWILVTCSTEYQGDERLAEVAAEALRGRPFRVLITLADAHERAGLADADNIVVRRFVPHSAVLERAAVVITHGGMGIVGKATCAGVPIVAVPFGRDQPEIARRVLEAGTGVCVPARKLTARTLTDAVHDALTKRARAEAVAADARVLDPGGRFADAVCQRLPAGDACRG